MKTNKKKKLTKKVLIINELNFIFELEDEKIKYSFSKYLFI